MNKPKEGGTFILVVKSDGKIKKEFWNWNLMKLFQILS